MFSSIHFIKNKEYTLNINLLQLPQYKKYNYYLFNFNFEEFILQLKESFNNYSIQKQFEIDLPRCNVFINGDRIQDSFILSLYLYNNFNYNKVQTLFMMTTQSIFGPCLELIAKNIDTSKFHIAEFEQNDKKSYFIIITIKNNLIIYKAKKELRIFSFENDRPINKYKISIEINYVFDSDMILYQLRIDKYN